MRTCDNGATNDDSCTDRNVAIIIDDSSTCDNEGTGAYIMLLKCGALLLTHIAMVPYCFYGELPYCNIVMQDLGTCVHWICLSLMNLIGVFG